MIQEIYRLTPNFVLLYFQVKGLPFVPLSLIYPATRKSSLKILFLLPHYLHQFKALKAFGSIIYYVSEMTHKR